MRRRGRLSFHLNVTSPSPPVSLQVSPAHHRKTYLHLPVFESFSLATRASGSGRLLFEFVVVEVGEAAMTMALLGLVSTLQLMSELLLR